jgi:hypothetical protein
LTPGKPATVVGDHLILCDQFACDLAKDLSHAASPWNQDQEWPEPSIS